MTGALAKLRDFLTAMGQGELAESLNIHCLKPGGAVDVSEADFKKASPGQLTAASVFLNGLIEAARRPATDGSDDDDDSTYTEYSVTDGRTWFKTQATGLVQAHTKKSSLVGQCNKYVEVLGLDNSEVVSVRAFALVESKTTEINQVKASLQECSSWTQSSMPARFRVAVVALDKATL